MSKILMLVEGQTEERFVKLVLYPHLSLRDLYPIPIIVMTKKVYDGADHKGGAIPYPRVKKQLLKLLNDTSAIAVTTMFDYYALERNFPGWDLIDSLEPVADCYGKVQHLEVKLSEDINNFKFIPYIQLHEFEGLLFASPSHIAAAFKARGTDTFKVLSGALQRIRDEFPNPEYINDKPETCPNRRIGNAIPEYQKDPFGTIIANSIELAKIRTECPHFNKWLERLEMLT